MTGDGDGDGSTGAMTGLVDTASDSTSTASASARCAIRCDLLCVIWWRTVPREILVEVDDDHGASTRTGCWPVAYDHRAQ